eukprot:1159072-Pelagomonas_calceolata.AAC.3
MVNHIEILGVTTKGKFHLTSPVLTLAIGAVRVHAPHLFLCFITLAGSLGQLLRQLLLTQGTCMCVVEQTTIGERGLRLACCKNDKGICGA